MRNLSVPVKESPSSVSVFTMFTSVGGTCLQGKFWRQCQQAGAFQDAIYSKLGRIVILGSTSADQFWSAHHDMIQVPRATLQQCITYYGDLDPPIISLDLGGGIHFRLRWLKTRPVRKFKHGGRDLDI